MRRFVVVGHTQMTRAPIPLKDPAGLGGRWDLLARCVTSGLLLSHGLRRDTEVVLVLGAGPEPRTIRIEGARIQGLNPDERSTLALLSRALEADPVKDYEESPHPGLWTSRRGLAAVLDRARGEGPLLWLDAEAPEALPAETRTGGRTFVLSDHRDFTVEERDLLRVSGARPARIGPRVLQADQCIVVAHHWLDEGEAEEEGGRAKGGGPSPGGLRRQGGWHRPGTSG